MVDVRFLFKQTPRNRSLTFFNFFSERFLHPCEIVGGGTKKKELKTKFCFQVYILLSSFSRQQNTFDSPTTEGVAVGTTDVVVSCGDV